MQQTKDDEGGSIAPSEHSSNGSSTIARETAAAHLSDADGIDPEMVVIDLYDHDKIGRGDHLGQVRLRESQLRQLVGNVLEVPLKPQVGMAGTKVGNKVKGSVRLCGHWVKGAPRLSLRIFECHDLAAADRLLGTNCHHQDALCAPLTICPSRLPSAI